MKHEQIPALNYYEAHSSLMISALTRSRHINGRGAFSFPDLRALSLPLPVGLSGKTVGMERERKRGVVGL